MDTVAAKEHRCQLTADLGPGQRCSRISTISPALLAELLPYLGSSANLPDNFWSENFPSSWIFPEMDPESTAVIGECTEYSASDANNSGLKTCNQTRLIISGLLVHISMFIRMMIRNYPTEASLT